VHGPVPEAAKVVVEPRHCRRDCSSVGIQQWPDERRMESHVVRKAVAGRPSSVFLMTSSVCYPVGISKRD
jgi:hypothetical protein